MKKVSIIVPVYNTKESYLRKCIESLINQTIDEIEIIIIDDGSREECAQICDEYGLKYKNVQVIHQKNQGQGMARSNGLNLASGEWIMFVDSDDWVENNICEKLLVEAKSDVDIIMSSCNECYKNKIIPIIMFDGKEQVWEKEKERLELQLISKSILGSKSYKAKNLMVEWAKLYRKSFLEKNRINMIATMQYMEDFIFNLYCFEHARKIVYKNYFLYNYRQRINSVSTNSEINRVEDYLKYLEAEKEFINLYNKPLIFQKAHEVRTISSIIAVINKNIFTPKVEYKKGKEKIKELLNKNGKLLYTVKLKYFTTYEKICIILLRREKYWLFRIMSLIRYNIKEIKLKTRYYV